METFCGVRCHLQRLGQGDGVILLHGWGQDMRMMRLIQNELKDHYRVVNLDLPGFGESGEPSAPWGIEEYARFIHEIAEHDHMEAPILIAHSFGARIAIRYASRYPTKKMVLSGAAGIRAPLSWQRRASQHWHHLKRRMGMRGSQPGPLCDPLSGIAHLAQRGSGDAAVDGEKDGKGNPRCAHDRVSR